MSIRENIELYGLGDVKEYDRILTEEFGVTIHPNQANAYMLEGLPFYLPRQSEDHVSILSFNKIPLPYPLVKALISHPELFSDDLAIRWTQEQELIFESTLGELRRQLNKGQE